MPSNVLEWSHAKVRSIVRLDEGAPLGSADAAPMNDARTGQFVKGNRAYRRRQLKAREKGLATLNPAAVPSWLKPFVEQGGAYIRALLALLDGRPELHALASDVADSHTLHLGLRQLALQADDPKERAALLSESRGWLREHRSGLATLAALVGNIKLPEPDPHAALAAIAKERT